MDKKKLAERLIQQAKNNELRKIDKSLPKITNEDIMKDFNIGKDKFNDLKNHDPEIKAIVASISQDSVPKDRFQALVDGNFEAMEQALLEARKAPLDNWKVIEMLQNQINKEIQRRGNDNGQDKIEANQSLLEHGLTPEQMVDLILNLDLVLFCLNNKDKVKELGWTGE